MCADIAVAVGRDMFGWPPVFSVEPGYQLSMIMPLSVNSDLTLGYVDQSQPCIAANNYNNNQQHSYVQQPLLPDIAEPSPPHAQPQNMSASVNVSTASVQRVARPILGAAANHGLPQPGLDKPAVANISSDCLGAVRATVPVTVDVLSQPPRPPSNCDSIANGRPWPPPAAVDSPNCMRSVTVAAPSSSPTLLQQTLAAADGVSTNPSHQFVLPPYCFMAPAAIPSTTMSAGVTSTSTVIAPAAVTANLAAAAAANLCTAGCCHCGQCQPTAPPVGAAYTYAYPPFMIPNAAPFLPSFGYALPGLPFPPPLPSLPPVSYSGAYTQSSDLVYSNQAMFTLLHQFQRPPPPAQAPLPPPPPPPPSNTCRGPPLKPTPVVTVPFNPHMPPPTAHVANPSSRRNGAKNSSCFNCGLVGHQANVCPEPLISSTAHTGTNLPPCLTFNYFHDVLAFN